jgi:L-ribulose-5-phosphate 4-epimerase
MLEDLKQTVCAANLALQRSGLVILTWGNVSAFDADSGLVVIKPSGVSYDAMTADQMVVLDLDGNAVEGDLRPSSDTPTHLALYRAFEGVSGIAHTHSPYATAWAQACRSLPAYGTTHADHYRGDIPVTAALTPEQIAGDYELETGLAIVKVFEGRPPTEMPAVLVASHGPFTWGKDAAAAVENSIVLEQVAMMAIHTEALSPQPRGISRNLLDKHFLRKHGKHAYYGQS